MVVLTKNHFVLKSNTRVTKQDSESRLHPASLASVCRLPSDVFVLSLLRHSPFLLATGHVQSDAQNLLMLALVKSLCLQLLREAVLLSITWYHEMQYKTGPTTLPSS